MPMIPFFKEAYALIAEYSILILELIGVAIIVASAVQSLIATCRREAKAARTHLTEGIASALTFMLAAEVVKSSIVRGWNELGVLGAIIGLRIIITIVIHWENKTEETKLSRE